MSEFRTVELYLDFISPYTWLALMAAEPFAADHRVRWELHPVVYGALLDAHGLVGPAETEAKRAYTFHDVARAAARRGLRLEGPPAHPFRSLEALRTLQLFREQDAALDLAVRISDAAWGRGKDLTDPGVLAEQVAVAGLDPTDLASRIAAPEVKEALKQATAGALARGVFGVPTFVHDGALFWGHDRMSHLADHLAGRLPDTRGRAEGALSRPRGADRRRRGEPGRSVDQDRR